MLSLAIAFTIPRLAFPISKSDPSSPDLGPNSLKYLRDFNSLEYLLSLINN